MKIRTDELTGLALNWAVAVAAMVQNALAKAKAFHREARAVADSLGDGIEKATKDWESRHA